MSFKADFQNWKEHPVTKAVLWELNKRVDALKDELAHSAGIDPLADRFKSGYIQAIYDFTDVELEDKDDE